MSVQPEDRTTIDMFSKRSPGRPRSSPYDRALQCKHNKRSQRLRDKAKGMHRLEVKLDAQVVQGLDQVCDRLNLSRAEVIEQALRQWLHL